MANTLIQNTPFIFVGLGTLTYTIPATDQYSVRVDTTEIPPSGVSIVVNDNGSPIFTAPVLGQSQIGMQFTFRAKLTIAHVITVVIASVDAEDLQLNTVKTSVSICQGL